jgi:hypothetical protein
MIGRTTCTNDYIRNIEKMGVRVDKWFDFSLASIKRLLENDIYKIDEILIIYKGSNVNGNKKG